MAELRSKNLMKENFFTNLMNKIGSGIAEAV
jgi:hypothetical protein